MRKVFFEGSRPDADDSAFGRAWRRLTDALRSLLGLPARREPARVRVRVR